MTTYTAITAAQIDADSPIDTTLMTLMRDNPIAITEGASGAPKIQQAALETTGGSEAVGQAQLKSTSGEVSASVPASSSAETGVLPGGQHGFVARVKGQSANISFFEYRYNSITTSFSAPKLHFQNANAVSAETGTGEQTYITASPPYDLGDGAVPQFIFVLVQDTPRTVLATYCAPEAPWHYNGPTSVKAQWIDAQGRAWRKRRVLRHTLAAAADDPVLRAELIADLQAGQLVDEEITQAIKQADMPLIPHPWIGHDLTGKTVVLLDPVAEVTLRLAELRAEGESVSEIIHADYLRPDTTTLPRSGPPGVLIVAPRWRST